MLYFSGSLALTAIAARVASSRYNIEMSSMYKSIRLPPLQRLRLGSARDFVNSMESEKGLISLCQSRGGCLRP